MPVALEAFEAMHGPNQLSKIPEHIPGRDEMLELHTGPRTEAGARENIRVGVQYLAAWLGGKGAVPLYNLMEDAATAEICRAQLWQWLQLRSAARRRPHASPATCSTACSRTEVRAARRRPQHRGSRRLFREMVTADEFEEFLTLPAYELLD